MNIKTKCIIVGYAISASLIAVGVFMLKKGLKV